MSELRRKILDASADLVAEHGVRQVSFREVARRAGVSHQAPYHHFGNYHGILRALVAEGFTLLDDAMRSEAESAGADPLDQLCAAGLAYVEFARNHVGHFRVMFQKALVNLHDDGEPMPPVADAYGTLVRLSGAAKKGGYGGELSVEAIIHLLWSAVHGVAVLLVEGAFANKGAGEEFFSALRDQVVHGLTALLRAPATHALQ